MENHQKTPGLATLLALLKTCSKPKDLCKGSKLHALIVKTGLLEHNAYAGSTLVHMYAKCGALHKAQEVFDGLPVRNIFSWNALIAGYARDGHATDALNYFESMQCEGLSPNAVTYVCVLKACGNIGASDKRQEIHARIVREGLLKRNVLVGTALVAMYAKCGALAKAQEVFDELPVCDVVTWSALIAGYAQHGHGEEALNCFLHMQCEGFCPDAVTFVCALKACGSTGAAEKGKDIHTEIVRQGLLGKNGFLGNALVDMYAKCGELAKAKEVFNKLSVRDVTTWNVLIAGYTQHGYGEEALNCLTGMENEGLSPDAATFISILKACGSIRAADKGREIHAEIVKEGLLDKNITIGTALVDMYAKCGTLAIAQQVFDELPVQNIVSWSALIAGYAQHGQSEEALNCFKQMQHEGLTPNAVTFLCILKACASIALNKGQEIHAEIVRLGLLEKHIFLGNALVDMYAKSGAFTKAAKVFGLLPVRNVATWSALITGYAQHGHGEEALFCFEQMQCEGLSANAVTFTGTLKACGSIGAADKGQSIHASILKEGLFGKDIQVGTALVDMYAKCGALTKAQEVFDKLPLLNVVSWNALMSGYAQLGKDYMVFNLINRMLGENVKPNMVTFTIVLDTCRHSGLLCKGQMCFEMLSFAYGIIPTLEHYTCMVDLFGRAGHFDNVITVIRQMPLSADLMVWLIVLGACQKWGNVRLGKLSFAHAVQLDETVAAAYVCMGNIYAAAGEDADEIEAK